MKARKCTLLLTYACNLNCIYCYERNKSNDKSKNMSFETARRIISDEISKLSSESGFDTVEFNFFGGEPLLRFDLIRNVVEWAEEQCFTEHCCFTATTNGTLVDDEVKAWCRLHKKHFALGLSIDGTDDIQQKNRGCRTSELPLDFAKELWPERYFKMTISKDSLPTLADSIIAMHEREYLFVSSLAEDTHWSEEDARQYKTQLSKLSEYYMKHRNVKPMHLFLISMQQLLDNRNMSQRKSCGIGDYSVAYDCDGTPFPCISLTPIVTDKWHSQYPSDTDFTANSADFQDEQCNGCILRNNCPTCYGRNLVLRGAFNRRDHESCKMHLAALEVIAQMQADYVRSQSYPATDVQKQRVTAAETILKILKQGTLRHV